MVILQKTVVALFIAVALASDAPATLDEISTKDDYDLEVAARDELHNSTDLSLLSYTMKSTMANYGPSEAKVQQRYLFPEGVEVKRFSLDNGASRTRRSADNQDVPQSAGGIVYLKPSDEIESDMTYVNHPEKTFSTNTKTFHKLSTTILITVGDSVGGDIFTPNYPLSYPNGADLSWLIAFPAGNVVKLELEDYETEECCDRLFIYDGYNTSRYPLASFEGEYQNDGTNIVYSTSQAMYIRFTSDCLSTGRGFHATYINEAKNKAPVMSCGTVELLGGNQGYIRSPNYPSTYDRNMFCTWSVQTDDSTRVKFVVNNFTIGYGDQLIFYDGTPDNPGSKIESLSGNVESGYAFYASSYQAFAVFTSDYSSDAGNKFDIFYTGEYIATSAPFEETTSVYYVPSQCNNSTSNVYGFGSIASPGFDSPGYYPMDDYCVWYVKGYSDSDIIEFYSQYFSTEPGYDYVRIYNGFGTLSSNLISEISGYVDPYTLLAVSDTQFATLQFSSDRVINDRGFDIHFYSMNYPTLTTQPPTEATTQVYQNTSCPDLWYGSSSGYVASPNYPSYYYNNMNCTTGISTPYGTYVKLTVQSLSLANGDYVRVYDGFTGEHLVTFTGSLNYAYAWQSSSDYIRIVFTSDAHDVSSGYYFRYDAVSDSLYPTEPPTDCGGTTPYNQGNISSNGYPNYAYSNNLDCLWTVYVQPNRYVLFTIVTFRTEECCDYVRIYAGTPSNPMGYVQELRGSEAAGTQILVPNSQAYVTFYTDSSDVEIGFRISYQAVPTSYIPTNTIKTIDLNIAAQNPHRRDMRLFSDRVQPVILGRDLWQDAKNKPENPRKRIGQRDQEDLIN